MRGLWSAANNCFFLFRKKTTGSCNLAAKMLAGFAKGNTEPSIWLKEGPAFLLPIVLAELS